MRDSDVKVGCTYLAKVSGKDVRVRIQSTDLTGVHSKGWYAVNMQTLRLVRIRTGRRLSEIKQPEGE